MKSHEIHRCLGDETRLRLLHLLARTPLCVCHLQGVLSLDQVVVSKQLAYLRRHGLVEGRRHQQWMIYSLPATRSPALNLQIRFLKSAADGDEVLQKDLRRLKGLDAECGWVPRALRELTAKDRKTASGGHCRD